MLADANRDVLRQVVRIRRRRVSPRPTAAFSWMLGSAASVQRNPQNRFFFGHSVDSLEVGLV